MEEKQKLAKTDVFLFCNTLTFLLQECGITNTLTIHCGNMKTSCAKSIDLVILIIFIPFRAKSARMIIFSKNSIPSNFHFFNCHQTFPNFLVLIFWEYSIVICDWSIHILRDTMRKQFLTLAILLLYSFISILCTKEFDFLRIQYCDIWLKYLYFERYDWKTVPHSNNIASLLIHFNPLYKTK